MESERDGVRHTQAVINSRQTAGGRDRIVDDTLADEIFTAWRYALCIRATEFLYHVMSETAWDKLPLEQKHVFYLMAPFLMTLDEQIYHIFIAR